MHGRLDYLKWSLSLSQDFDITSLKSMYTCNYVTLLLISDCRFNFNSGRWNIFSFHYFSDKAALSSTLNTWYIKKNWTEVRGVILLGSPDICGIQREAKTTKVNLFLQNIREQSHLLFTLCKISFTSILNKEY